MRPKHNNPVVTIDKTTYLNILSISTRPRLAMRKQSAALRETLAAKAHDSTTSLESTINLQEESTID